MKAKTAEPVMYRTAMPPVVKNTAPHKAFNQCAEKRAGDPMVAATGRPGASGEKPVMAKSSGFGSAGTKRHGDNMVQATGRPGAAGECPVTK